MKEEIRKNGNLVIREFKSINEYVEYIDNTPVNKHFGGKRLESSYSSYYFTNTNSFDEARQLLSHGWDAGTQQIKMKLRTNSFSTGTKQMQRSQYGMAGYQACVPRYLQGVPDSMIYKKQVSMKQKILTVDKIISYTAAYSTDDMLEYGRAAVQFVQALENMGYRINLNIIVSVVANSHREVCKIRIKSADERLNLSKMAFPMAHPSMFRRFTFKFIETSPTITSSFVHGYGSSDKEGFVQDIMPDDIVIPADTRNVDELLEELKRNGKIK